MKLKDIYKLHHYLGTFFFIMFLIWFLSGFVMMYKSFPFLSQKKRIEHNQVVSLEESSLVHPSIVFEEYQQESNNSLRVNTILGKTVYHLVTNEGKLVSRFAHNKKGIKINKPLAIKIARNFTGINSNAIATVLNKVDQWIPRPRYLKHLPVYKVKFKDHLNTFVHISSQTGEVLSQTSYTDRLWAWLGPIPHWLYLKEIRSCKTLWSQLCIWLSLLGFIMSLSGIITGVARYRKKPKARFKRYKNKWYNVHYYTGLVFGLFICTWIFSGFMSMSPFNWSQGAILSAKGSKLWHGRSDYLKNITDEEWTNFKHSIMSKSVKEAHFSSFSGKLFSIQFQTNLTSSICLSNLSYRLSEADLSEQVNYLDTVDFVYNIEQIKDYDNYYYDRHNNKKLPVYKVSTKNDIVYYVDPANGKMLLRSDIKNKLERWLYHGLHSLDFHFLINNRPLWDIVMILLLLGGTTVSLTAAGLGIKFILRKRRGFLKRRYKRR
ncbi:PepSY domain-containing protein [Tenacibaculum sp. C7A-26P2]|uniref:PepSY domain-containing protein n=1 Tax=Tenacibaculum sp. C7A-26P2 TaxID=3447504 RepID=UPI003F82C847